MIKVIEKDFLDDNFIIKAFTENISLKDNIYFSKENIYYFGNYKENKIDDIKKKILKNKKRIINAIERNVTFIIHGNSIDLFNNTFKKEDMNLFTAYDKKSFNITFKKLKLRKKENKNLIKIDDLKKGVDTLNFKYKNLLCFK